MAKKKLASFKLGVSQGEDYNKFEVELDIEAWNALNKEIRSSEMEGKKKVTFYGRVTNWRHTKREVLYDFRSILSGRVEIQTNKKSKKKGHRKLRPINSFPDSKNGLIFSAPLLQQLHGKNPGF
jgi:hypothetical protein